MTPEEALKFIDRCADGGLGAPDYAEAYGIVDAALARAAEMEAERNTLVETINAMNEVNTQLSHRLWCLENPE